ncbi:phage holin family protein [Stutzerimonas stutzeri]|uniref:phage holin family protein n=1 Tax=Stutzerimonas stutzeri TaxID=316 RepID=UPI002658F26F|nr:phage holin family protein [Stutzerimonas stutzeri]MCF6780904.1 phage holin family protein [Stutzerimonas stutzeri]MCF6803473.1 phage holin family protein [Stutzerimonas stutzeri]
MDSLILTYVTMVLSAVMFVRMFTYRRGGAQFRRDVSIMAALIMACCGATVIYILAGELVVPVKAWPMVLLLAVLTAMRCGGNLSKVLRHPYGWDGRERRRR